MKYAWIADQKDFSLVRMCDVLDVSMSDYHRRSLFETKMRCLKLLGERIMAPDFYRQVAELQVPVALLNRFTQLGTPVTATIP